MARRKGSGRLNLKGIKRGAPSRDVEIRVLIVTEGSKTEPDYFRRLVKELELTATRVKIVGDGGSAPISVVEAAKEFLGKDSDFEQVYCVFDKDTHEKYDEAIQKLQGLRKQQRYKGKVICAIASVPCFEVWYLLHLSETSKPYVTQDELIRDLVQKSPFQSYQKNECGSFFGAIAGHRKEASMRAERLLKQARARGETEFHENPSTRVYEVVQALTKLSRNRMS